MICRECGNDNGTIVDTCVACGQSLQASMGLDSDEDMEICPECGSTQSRDDRAGEQSASRFCGECGNQLRRADETNLPVDLLSVQLPTLAFYDAMRLIMANYMKFNGRSRRSEYWWFQLFIIGVQLLEFLPVIGTPIVSVVVIVFVVPSVAVTTRRLHDINKSGWWQLPINFILLFSFYSMVNGGLIALPVFVMIFSLWIYWLTQKGDTGSNYYGSDPRLHYGG